MNLNLHNKRAAITGASKGIGAAIAAVLAEEGCRLHLIARGKERLDDIASRLRHEHGVEATAHPADLRRSEEVRRIAGELPNLDILVNNAGDIPGGTLNDVDEETWRRAWDLKIFGFIDLTRIVYAKMKTTGGGVILNTIGLAGERFDFDYIAGSAGNAALMAFTRALGSRSLEDNIRVVGVNPGPVETDRILALTKTKAKARFNDESRYKELMAHWPRGRAAKPREIADMFAFLASDRSAYTSGIIVTIDGGLSSRGGL
jgi:NAD(P)-dependent dehydrogenase (short-subunit alcohol dehydrogenase family)